MLHLESPVRFGESASTIPRRIENPPIARRGRKVGSGCRGYRPSPASGSIVAPLVRLEQGPTLRSSPSPSPDPRETR
jgi:hypothetical protein